MKATEVTQAEWVEVIGVNLTSGEDCGTDCPADRVSWFEALEYCNRLSDMAGLDRCYELSGRHGIMGSDVASNGTLAFAYDSVTFKGVVCNGFRLPTEAEWEYAARGQTQTDTYAGDLHYSDEAHSIAPELDTIAWYLWNSQVSYANASICGCVSGPCFSCGPHPVGLKLPNAFGMMDILGNAGEWCWDLYNTYPENLTPDGPVIVDPIGPEHVSPPFASALRVWRGGNWGMGAGGLRAAARFGTNPAAEANGLRPVRSVTPRAK